jgi:predicted RNA-binding protein with TRAM domain
MLLHGSWPARQAVGLQQLLRASVRTVYSSASNRRQSAAATATAQSGDAVTAPQKGQQLELECSDLAFGGEGICKLPGGGLVVFVERALPGERLVARITETKKRFAKAVKLSTLRPHDAAVEPPCQVLVE